MTQQPSLAAPPAPKPFIIPVFLPHKGCPHRCVFCNQNAMDASVPDDLEPENLRQHARVYLAHKARNRRPVEVAFYGGTFLGMRKDRVVSFLKAAADLVEEGLVDTIRFSTRPDTVTQKALDRIARFPVGTVELGVQSMNDAVLAGSGRGHSAADTVKAVALLKSRGFGVGVQLMVGLPGDTEAGSFSSAEKIAALGPHCIRIYPTVVLKGSLLEKWYIQGKYAPWSLDACIRHVKRLYLFFSQKGIRVIRMGLQASGTLKPEQHLVAGPFHPAFGQLVQSEIFLDTVVSFLEKKGAVTDPLTLRLHPNHRPKMAGHANRNLGFLKKRFHLHTVSILPDPSLSKECLFIQDAPVPVPC